MKSFFLQKTLLQVFAFLFLSFVGITNMAFAQAPSEEGAVEKVTITIFEREDCQHCQAEKAFLDQLLKERSDIQIQSYDINESDDARKLWIDLVETEKLSKATPVTFIANQVLQGFNSDETTGVIIKQLIDTAPKTGILTVEEFIKQGGSQGKAMQSGAVCNDETGICDVYYRPVLVSIPLLGVIDIKEYSLPSLSIILGFIDGFNPCAMWVLVTFLLVLMQAGDRRKMWLIAGMFIFAETVMYYLILNVWFTVWDFVGLDAIITPIVGAVAIAAGGYFLYEWKTSDGSCKVTSFETRSKTSKKIQMLVNAEFTLLTLLGILGLAFSVNIIEFACSVGIPQTFTKILELNALSFLEQQFYMFLYILFYMVDDFIVFGIALYSFEKIGLTTKYSQWSHLIGGTLMIILGLILLLKPDLLVF